MRFNTLSDWLSWQEQLHPETIELGLERVKQVWERLHSGSFDCPVITVAGTNGKGSSVAMLQAIYSAAGYQVGSYTSPHLLHYNERIRIDGEPVDDKTICASFERVDRARGNISLTYFEFGTLAALDIFRRTSPDVVILEVGLGGRLDAVNIIDADVALITSIALDHQQWLGHDRETIGNEKAGILRRDKPGVVSDPDVPSSIRKTAESIGAELHILGDAFTYKAGMQYWEWFYGDSVRSGLPIPALNGAHQIQNASGVLMVVELLSQRLPVSQSHLRDGLLNAHQAGRFSIIPGEPTVILDVAHNPAAVNQLLNTLGAYKRTGKIHAVFSCLADKDINLILKPACRVIHHWYLAELAVPRAAKIGQMTSVIDQFCPNVECKTYSAVKEAYLAAMTSAEKDDLVVVFGSFYTVADVMQEGL